MMNKTMPVAIIVAIFVLGSCLVERVEMNNPDWETELSLYADYDGTFLIGNIIRSSGSNDLGGIRFDILKHHFNSATAENDMKPDYIAPSSKGGAYKWSDADKIVAAANEAGLAMHGHTLIWHDQTPGWMTSGSAADIMNNLKKYVTDVTTHFKDNNKVISWDVVNEAIDLTDNLNAQLEGNNWEGYDWTKALRDSPWNKAGTTYIEEAFRAARAADSEAKLFYNDFNLNSLKKSRATYLMVKDINTRNPNVGGRPLIDGIGMQTHHHLNTNPATVRAAIELFVSLGVEIAVSEMDVVAADGGEISDSRLGRWDEAASQKQAELYAKLFVIFKKYSEHITRVTFWGLDDATSWRSQNHPTLLDRRYGLKPAFFAVQNPSLFLGQ
ncbi:MAG: endo-1,4-beta-xylanase [Treponema sp.]|jgi:endo-1,4-beta-xylanase|nr:endo-1,4-beta-xylanase [Treponema sp.]